jgi:hypothetical protein
LDKDPAIIPGNELLLGAGSPLACFYSNLIGEYKPWLLLLLLLLLGLEGGLPWAD